MPQDAAMKRLVHARRGRRRLALSVAALVCAILLTAMSGSAQESTEGLAAQTFIGILRPEATVVLSAQVDGQIASFPFEIGDPVETDQLVAQIDDSVAIIQRDYSFEFWKDTTASELADLAFEAARKELEKVKLLHDGGTASGEELEQAKTALLAAEIRKRQEAARKRMAELDHKVRNMLLERHRVLKQSPPVRVSPHDAKQQIEKAETVDHHEVGSYGRQVHECEGERHEPRRPPAPASEFVHKQHRYRQVWHHRASGKG